MLETKIRPFKYLDGKPIIPRYIAGIMQNVYWTGLYTYCLVGVNRNRPVYGIDADIAKLQKWAESHGAEFIITKRSYERKKYFIVFEMSDPVAHALEKAGLVK